MTENEKLQSECLMIDLSIYDYLDHFCSRFLNPEKDYTLCSNIEIAIPTALLVAEYKFNKNKKK